MEILCLWRDDFPDERGEIIAVRQDGFAWGSKECLGSFLVVRIPNAPELSEILESKGDDGLGWYVMPDAIPATEVISAQTADWHVIEVALDAIEAR